jgi:uncharacterized protein (DUF1330 family)
MPAAYVLGSYDIVDPEGYEGYVPGVLPLLEKHGAEVLVAEFDAEPLEGEKRSVYCVLKFESEEAALAWYNDPTYQPVKQHRVGSSKNGSMILARAFVPQPVPTI